MRHGWELETEVNAFIRGNSELDAIVIERGREPVGIEAKFATTTNAKNLIAQAETRLVLELETEYHVVGKTLNNVMAILYPDRFKTMSGADINPQLRAKVHSRKWQTSLAEQARSSTVSINGSCLYMNNRVATVGTSISGC